MKGVASDVDASELLVADLDAFLVDAVVEAGVDRQAGRGRRSGDQVDDDLKALQRLAAPVEAHEAEHPMLDLVPLARGAREVADADPQARLIGQALKLDAPQPGTWAVGPARVGRDRQLLGVRVALLAEVLPP